MVEKKEGISNSNEYMRRNHGVYHTFEWNLGGSNVQLFGDFNNW